jgi:hypothetical protein
MQDVFGDEGWGRISSSFRSNSSLYDIEVRANDSYISFAINFNDPYKDC